MSDLHYDKFGRLLFTKEMKKEYTILLPMMLPIHFKMIKNIFNSYGYKTALLENSSPKVIDEGLKYVHNDTCYPALLVIGQFIDALKSGKYDVTKTALMITQTGGGCRASNYIHLLRKALKKAGFQNVPVISLNLSGLEKNSGFSLTLPMLKKIMSSLVYGDMLMFLKNQIFPYEINHGKCTDLIDYWTDKLTDQFKIGKGSSLKEIKLNLEKIAHDFSKIETKITPKVKVGIVGEIYIKYSALGNNYLEDFLMSQGCEICVPGIINFMLFKVDNRIEDVKIYGGNIIKKFIATALFKYLEKMEKLMIDTLHHYSNFSQMKSYRQTKKLVNGIIGYGNKMGEGWLLTAEMLELIESGFENIICAQPFGCLPNHICGKGMIRKIRQINKNANIVAVDYDPGSSKVNQENRIKLMLSLAKENIKLKVENGTNDFKEEQSL